MHQSPGINHVGCLADGNLPLNQVDIFVGTPTKPSGANDFSTCGQKGTSHGKVLKSVLRVESRVRKSSHLSIGKDESLKHC